MSSHPSSKERLSKLFRRSGEKSQFSKTTKSPPSSPASPNANVSKDHLRNKSSKASLRDLVSGKRRSRLLTSDDVPDVPTYGAQVAAATAMGVEDRLPGVSHQSNLSDDLQRLNFNKGSDEGQHSQRVGNGNVGSPRDTHSSEYSGDHFSGSPPLHSRQGRDNLRNASLDQGRLARSKPVLPQLDPYSGSVADWNIAQSDFTSTNGKGHATIPQTDKSKSSIDEGRRNSMSTPLGRVKSAQESLKATTRKLVNGTSDGRGSRDRSSSPPKSPARGSIDSQARGVRRFSLQKSLPNIPAEKYVNHAPEVGEIHSELGMERGYLVKDAPAPVPLEGIVDLSNTEDTTLHERWAPAVTHETVVMVYHEIEEQQITRSIHQDHIFHRILPVIDIEVKPARHFIPVEGGYAEVAAEELPGRTGDKAQWLIAELASKALPPAQTATGPRKFTARKFEGAEGDYKEYTAPEGHPKTERTWIHPPRLEDGGELTGQTYPFYFDSDDPRDNGLRAMLPEGKIVGTSQLFARQVQASGMNLSDKHEMANGDLAPPVPLHGEINGHNNQSTLRDDTMSPRFV